MKKFISMMLVSMFLLIASQSKAQYATLMPLVAGDTIANTGTVTKVITFTAGYSGVALQTVLTKLSGTGAGTVGVYGSLDGTNYVQIGSNFTITNVTTQSATFYVTAPLPPYIKVLATGSGTESVIMRTYYVPRKYYN